MSSCSNNHCFKDAEGAEYKHIYPWSCPECQWNYLRNVGLFLLAFSVPVFYIIFGDTAMGTSDGEEGAPLGLWMVFIMWWTILGMFSSYREKIEDLKYKLLEMKAVSHKLTREEIEDASKKDLLNRLKYFLEGIREKKQGNIKALDYNMKAIDLLFSSFASKDFDESYKIFCDYINGEKNNGSY